MTTARSIIYLKKYKIKLKSVVQEVKKKIWIAKN